MHDFIYGLFDGSFYYFIGYYVFVFDKSKFDQK